MQSTTYLPGTLRVIDVEEKKAPIIIEKPHLHEELVLPDTHGDVAGIIHKLRTAGVMTIPDESLEGIEKLVKLKTEHYNKDTLSQFDELLKSATFYPDQYKLIRFLGDMLADRSGNDWFTLKFLEKLVEKNIKFEINLSNHDLEFLRCYHLVIKPNKKDIHLSFAPNMGYAPTASLYSLAGILKNNLVTKEQIINLVEKCYLPFLKLPQVTFDEEKYCEDSSALKPQAIMYTHAPGGTEITQPLHHIFCKSLQPDPNIETVIDLMDAHDSIQEGFQKDLKSCFWRRPTILNTMEDNDIEITKYNPLPLPVSHPLEYTTWNRTKEYITCPKNYDLHVVHGHTGENMGDDYSFTQTWNLHNVMGYNLDEKNNFGKSLDSSQNSYTIYTSPSYIPSFKKLYNALQKRKNEINDYEYSVIYLTGLNLYDSAKELLKFCMKNNLREQYRTVKNAIIKATQAIENPNEETFQIIKQAVDTVTQLKSVPKISSSSKAKKCIARIVGALCVIAGVCIIAAGVFGIPFTLGMSIGLACGLGSGLIAFGLAMISRMLYSDYAGHKSKLFSQPSKDKVEAKEDDKKPSPRPT